MTQRSLREAIWLIVVTALAVGSAGCQHHPVDRAPALAALDRIHLHLARSALEQAAVSTELATVVADVAAERMRLRLLLDLDELMTPEGTADAPAVDRLLREGSQNVIIRDLRLGLLSRAEAVQIVRDAATVRQLSADLRRAAERELLARLTDWRRVEELRQRVLAETSRRHAEVQRLVEEAQRLTAALREAPVTRGGPSAAVGSVTREAMDLIDDPGLRESVREVVDLLLPSPSSPVTSNMRSEE